MQILTEPSSGAVAVRSLPDLQAESILRSILHSIDHGVLLTDLEHRSLACNRRFGEIFGVDPEEAVRLGVEELRDRVAPRIVNSVEWRHGLETIYADPRARYEDEIVLRCPGEMYLRRVAAPVLDVEGRVFGRLWTFTDVSEARRRRRNHELLRTIGGLTDPDPATVLGRICQAVSNHYGGGTVAKVTILEGCFLRFHVVAGDLGPAKDLEGIDMRDTYCGFTLGDDATLLVQDALADARYARLLPATVGYCRYLGVPIRDETGRALGTFCIVDTRTDQPLGPSDVELIEMVSIRINAELTRERYIAERMAEKDRTLETKRREIEETSGVLDTMNEAFALLFEAKDTVGLLKGLAELLRNVLGYGACAVYLRRADHPRYQVAAGPSGDAPVRAFEADLAAYPRLLSCVTGGTDLDTNFIDASGDEIGRLLGMPWAAVSCLPKGEWGEALVVLGRGAAPPERSARHVVQLAAVMDGVRLVLAAHALNEGIAQANRARTEALEKALRSEKLAIAGTLAASTAHDIRNIVASLSMLTAETSDPAASLHAVREQLDRFSVLAHRLLSYARPGQVERCPIDLVELLDRALNLTSGQMRVSRVEACLRHEALPPMWGDAHQLQHLFVNLVLNAVQAMERRGGHLTLEARVEGDAIVVKVLDDGPGVPQVVQDRLFQPFASSRPSGFGLGLYSARRIVQAHGGTIFLSSNEPHGTVATVTLPCGAEVSE